MTTVRGKSGVGPPILRRTFRFFRRGVFLAAAVVGAGAPAAVLVILVDMLQHRLIPVPETGDYHELVMAAASSLTGMFLLGATVLVFPSLWRRTSDPNRLRALAYGCVQLCAVSFGLIAGSELLVEETIAWIFGGVGTIGWWAWQHKWKGTGIAPSVFTGVLKPAICAGQVWFATVPGHQETKARPVLVLAPGEDERTWVCAYFTTQAPRSAKVATMYIRADADQIRGLSQTNWVQTRELKTLNRRAFRSYTGLAPRWLYEAACHGSGTPTDPNSRTIEEGQAGASLSPFEQSLLYTLGVKKAHPDLDLDASVIRPFVASLFTTKK